MYLFTRTGRARPGTVRDTMAWAVGITEKVNQITSLDVSLWTTLMSPGNGTLVWSTFVPDLTSLEDADAKLMVDDMFVAELDRGAQHIEAGIDDEVAQLLAGEVDPNAQPRYVSVVRSELLPGGFQKGVEAGIEIAERATKLGGLATSFLLSTTGKYGGVAWVSGSTSLAELEAADSKVNADADFIKYVDKVSPHSFVPGITTQAIYSRIT